MSLRQFVETSATRPDAIGVIARTLLKRPPARWSAATLRKWAQAHQEDSIIKLLDEWQREGERPGESARIEEPINGKS